MDKLTTQELHRYSRHLVLRDFGMQNQLKLRNAKVLVVGAGGLGCPVLLYLTAAGVGAIGIIDSDTLEISNLQRQVLYTINDIGKNKSEAAAERLSQLNPLVDLKPYVTKLTSQNALQLVSEYDVIVDGTDNFPTRYLINDACVLSDKPFVYASILEFEGQVAVFNYRKKDGKFSANYRDIFSAPPALSSVPNCEEAGVLGVLPGLMGCIQANETIKIITGVGEPLSDKLLILDATTMQQTIIKIGDRSTRQQIRTLIDYDDFCGINAGKNKSLDDKELTMKEVTVQELKALMDSNADFQLIDVREPHEYDICNLNGELIPMSDIPTNVDKISKTRQVVIHCRSGKRSGDMLLWLEKNHGFTNLYNLKGGTLAWSREIDPEFPTY
ncbi:MAG TPA: molybdopterin-synthase adenylyltransferase MoeB [Chryseosolibacter sp.]|jgi:Dinucleotide-utilizing enzymes involved in molybdopterin and thiamine biosynthesis family 2